MVEFSPLQQAYIKQQNHKIIKIMKSKVFLLLLLIASVYTQYYTSDVRTQSVTELCENFEDRTTLVDESEQADNDDYKSFISKQLTADGNQLILDLLAGNTDTALSQVNQIAMFVGPFVLGFVIIILIWMFLGCCCCCPSCCPSKCCQKPDQQAYTKCQLIWPTVILVLALLLIIIMSVIGITKAAAVEEAYEATTCALSIAIDDLINGNLTTTDQLFIGLNPLIEQLTDLKDTYMVPITADLDLIDGDGGSEVTRLAYDKGQLLLPAISEIPTGTAGQSMSSFQYDDFDGSNLLTMESTFPNTLGGVTAQSGKVYDAYYDVQVVQVKLDAIMASATQFKTGSVTFNSEIDGAIDAIQSLTDSLEDSDKSFGGSMKQGKGVMKYVTIAVTAIFGVFIGFGVLSLLGALMMTFCQKYSCRYLVYFACCFLFLLGIFTFILAIFFSIFTPILYYSCDFLQFSVESGENFRSNFEDLMGSDTADQISVCMSGEDGNIIDKVAPDINDVTQGLSDTITQMNNFDASNLRTDMANSWDALETSIFHTQASAILDWDTTTTVGQSNKLILQKLADPTNYAEYDGCTNNNFAQDSWVPSTHSGAAISCSSSSSGTANITQCSNIAAIQAGSGAAPNTCVACINTYDVIVHTNAGATIGTNLKNRYSAGVGDECEAFADDMQLLWDHYYLKKNTVWTPIITEFNQAEALYDPVGQYDDLVEDVGDTFATILTNMEGASASITDPEYGMVAGLNCLLFGEDFRLIIDTMCVRLFNVFYMLRFTLGISAMCILFVMCCSVCSGVRHYKHAVQKGLLVPKDGGNGMAVQDETMAQLNMKNFEVGKR